MGDENILKDILDKPKPLSQEQRKVLLSNNRYIRIVAGAGTGKTETLTRRIAYLLLYKNVEPKDIVAFTFTEKAAQSMKSRIYERVRYLHGDKACTNLGEMYVGTIHGYCLRILQDHFGYGGHEVLDENQEMAFLLREGWGLGLGSNGRYSQNCSNFLRSINVIYDELLDREKLKEEAAKFYKQFERYEDILQKHRLLTFGKMVSITVENLRRNPDPIANIKHLIVDEYQDINKAQEALIRIIAKNSSLFIVGDPRQSIYQWRGSDESCFESFIKLFPSSEKINITENRRSAKRIIDVANAFAGSFEKAHYEKLKHVRLEEGRCFFVTVETPEKEAEWLASQVDAYVNSGRCNYKDIGILLRSVSTSGGPVIDLFRRKNIPYIVGGTVGLFRRDEAQAVGRLFVWTNDDGFWIENPWNWSARTEGDELLKTALEHWESATSISLSIFKKKDLYQWKKRLLSGDFKHFTEAYQELLTILGFLSLDPLNRLHATVLANLGRFNTLLTDYESSLRLGGRPVNWPYAMKGLCWYINTYASGSYDEQPSEDLRGINAVQIMTVHQAKGLEWPIVFIPSLVDRRFPSSQTGNRQDWFVPRNMFDAERYEGDIEGERRLFYVAVTRAKDLLCLSKFRRIKVRTSESRFIDPIKNLLIEMEDSRQLPIVDITTNSNDEEIQTYTAGEIISFMRCPYFYCFREIWNYQAGLATELGYGKSLHFCLRNISELIKTGYKPYEAVRKSVEENFHLPFAGEGVKENMKRGAQKVLHDFVLKNLQDMSKIEEVETRIEFPLQKATITGRVDVIMRDHNDYEARDYKTSDEMTTEETSAFQVKLYTLGLRSIGRPVTKASVAVLEEGRVKSVDISDRSIAEAKALAEKAIESIHRGNFNPSPGQFCPHCDYSKICISCPSG